MFLFNLAEMKVLTKTGRELIELAYPDGWGEFLSDDEVLAGKLGGIPTEQKLAAVIVKFSLPYEFIFTVQHDYSYLH